MAVALRPLLLGEASEMVPAHHAQLLPVCFGVFPSSGTPQVVRSSFLGPPKPSRFLSGFSCLFLPL